MDTLFLSLSLTFLLFGLSLYVLWPRNKSKNTGRVLPPGVMGWPIVGETLEFFRSASGENPENFFMDRMKKYSPKAFKTSMLGQKVAVLCGASGNKCMFSGDNKNFTLWSPSIFTKVFISPENRQRGGDESIFTNELRKLTNEFVKPEVLQKKFTGIIDYMSKQHIKKEWAPHQRQVLAYEMANKYTFELACRLFMSIEETKEVAKLEGLFQSLTNGLVTVPIDFPGTTFNRAIKSARALRNEFLPIIKQRKRDILDKKLDAETSQDMLSHLLLSTYDEDGEFPNDMVVADMFLFLLIAGHNTSSTTITFIVNYLAELPHVYAEVLKEQMEIARNKKPGELLKWEDIQKMKYSWSVANETMRLAPPTPGNYRVALTDITYAGFTIPKGWKAYYTPHSTNKNPEYFPNPEIFDPTRFYENRPEPFSFVPFGGGTHICPGREYARAIILAFMHNLVTQFDLEKLLPDEKIIYAIGPRPANGLPVRLHPHNGHTN